MAETAINALAAAAMCHQLGASAEAVRIGLENFRTAFADDFTVIAFKNTLDTITVPISVITFSTPGSESQEDFPNDSLARWRYS